jgi:hypothetical protein
VRRGSTTSLVCGFGDAGGFVSPVVGSGDEFLPD